jgi:hypothetical protein
MGNTYAIITYDDNEHVFLGSVVWHELNGFENPNSICCAIPLFLDIAMKTIKKSHVNQ